MKKYFTRLFAVGSYCLLLVACSSPEMPQPPAVTEQQLRSGISFEQVRPVLNARCIACHSCFESPCQLNLQTWDGLRRGAFHEDVYDGLRSNAVPPQRMFEDAQNEQEWRGRGFIDVLEGEEDSILMRAVRMSNLKRELPSKAVGESLICPQKKSKATTSDREQLSMPYGLPALSQDQQSLLNAWVIAGAKGVAYNSSLSDFPKSVVDQVHEWTKFFNADDLKSRITARYLYEHLYLAHLYFKEQPRSFFKIVRSSTACDVRITPIATRRPNNDPGQEHWYYCFAWDPATVVYKNHLPYELSPTRLAWMKHNFFTSDWAPTSFPSFEDEVAANPLVAYQEMPVIARYRFLLHDSHYEVATFIKGPVCNGSFAVNSIQEQFYVFFMNPTSDLMVKYPDYARNVAKELILPGNLGSNMSRLKVMHDYEDILRHRAIARESLNQQLQVAFPQGLKLGDIWDGDGENDNAVLTVFRNDDNARVFKGAKGDVSKTDLLLDYSTFERLVYNLAINFDVFDNVSHQILTRLYMDILRMDAEDNFLQFLPSKERLQVKNQWYQGAFTKIKLAMLDENKFASIPQGIIFSPEKETKTEFVQKILFERLNAKTRGPNDVINWKVLQTVDTTDPVEYQLHRIASVKAEAKSPFAQFFPEHSLLILAKDGIPQKTYSVLHNREHENVAWILDEKGRLAPEEDTLSIFRGIGGAYPNQFFVVEENSLAFMVDQVSVIQNKKQYEEFFRQYGIKRMDGKFWKLYDFVNADLQQQDAVAAGILDLSRYAL